MNNKGKLKKILKQLPVNISITGLAILAVIADRAGHMFIDLLGADKREGAVASFRRFDHLRDFDDYYEIIKNFVSSRESARTLLWRLQQKGLVAPKGELKATTLGKKVAEMAAQKLKESAEWDNKYRITFFDIPEIKRGQRSWLYHSLINEGFRPMQKSVFIGKTPVSEELMEEIIKRNLYPCVRIITVGEMDDESILS